MSLSCQLYTKPKNQIFNLKQQNRLNLDFAEKIKLFTMEQTPTRSQPNLQVV